MEIAILVFSGIIGGMIAGLLGLGGGIFYILILPYIINYFGVPQENASVFIVANSLFGIAFASASSLISEMKYLKQYVTESLFLGIPAVLISLLSTRFIVQSEWFSIQVFNILVIILMIFILIQLQLKREKTSENKKLHFMPASITGSLAGFISALSGLGGGIILIPILQLKFKQSIRKAKLISLVVIFLSSTFITLENLISVSAPDSILKHQWGYILPALVIPLVIGVLIGSPIGVKLSYRLQEKNLNLLFSLFVMIVLIEKLILFF